MFSLTLVISPSVNPAYCFKYCSTPPYLLLSNSRNANIVSGLDCAEISFVLLMTGTRLTDKKTCSALLRCSMQRLVREPTVSLSRRGLAPCLPSLKNNPKRSRRGQRRLAIREETVNGRILAIVIFTSRIIAAMTPVLSFPAVQWKRQPSVGLSLICRRIMAIVGPPWSRI